MNDRILEILRDYRVSLCDIEYDATAKNKSNLILIESDRCKERIIKLMFDKEQER